MMTNYFRSLTALGRSPKGQEQDVHWLENLPQGDYLAAQDIVIARLRDFFAGDSPLDQQALDALMLIDERRTPIVRALTRQYVHAISLPKEVDERLWQSVSRYYALLASAYQRFLDHALENAQSLPHDFPQLLLNILDCRRCLAMWRYFRFQQVGVGEWTLMHQTYRLAEKQGCTKLVLWRHRSEGETTIMTTYLQALMLGTIAPSDLLKHEVEIVANLLAGWCGSMKLADEFEPAEHLFYVNLDGDKGGRRIRRVEPRNTLRYWDTDAVVASVARAHLEIQQGKIPSMLGLPAGVRPADCQPLLEYLLAAWSRNAYQRQRRSEERRRTRLALSVVDGVESVCQFVRNASYSRRKDQAAGKSEGVAPAEFSNEATGEMSPAFPGVAAEKWMLFNESERGFGAEVRTYQNAWLRVGRLVAFDDGRGRHQAMVGVVRNIQFMQEDRRNVGIEVLSRRPTCVSLRSLDQRPPASTPAETDIFTASTLTGHGALPFVALYLPKDETRQLSAMLILPVLEYLDGGVYELRSEPYLYRIKLGRVIERNDDWICVAAGVLDKDTRS